MKFSEFLGNERIVSYFKRAIQHDHLGHAFLFSGPSGVGKRTLAALLCKSLLCRDRSAVGPCETCASCHKFESGNHPDFHPFEPDGLYFKIGQVREIIHLASFKPVESRWKTFLLEGVDYMREEGANAFLKVLEEPPGETVFFLISESAEVLLPTIRSRCQHFVFQPVTQEQIKRWLIEKMELSDAEAAARAPYAHGSLGRALTLNPEQYTEMRNRVLAALEASMAPKAYFTVLDATRAITVERTEMAERFAVLEELIHDLLALKASTQPNLIHEDLRQRLTPLAAKMSLTSLQSLHENLLQTREAVLKINANIGLALQALLLPVRADNQ